MATRPVDEKIVVLKMDNSDLVQKAKEATNIFTRIQNVIAKLPKINLGKTANELGKIQSEVNNTNFQRMADGVQAVTSRLSNMGIVGITALQNITNRAVDAGIALGKSLTVDQVVDGFSEYELKIKSIGTMLSNTEWAGSTLEDVQKTLGELNDYADKTVYNFGEMTASIGRFTAAGVTLEDSATAIKGLGNLAASSGASSEQLNTAMYQMSQALASGKLTLEDWNSLVNAGMAGKKTQDALVKTAKAMGKTVDMTDGFRNSIQDGWLTSEVFLETLKKFGNDEAMTKMATSVRTFSALMDSLKEGIGSGWAETFEHMFGDFEEATVLFTNLSESISGWFQQSADIRNQFVGAVADGGGFENLFAGVQNAFRPVTQVLVAFETGLKKAFPTGGPKNVIKMTESFKKFTEGLVLNSGTVTKLTTVFQGGFSIFNSVFQIVKQLGSAFLNLIPPGAGTGILDLLVKVAEMLISFNESIKAGNLLTKSISAMGVVFKAIGTTIGDVGGAVMRFAGSIVQHVGTAVNWLKQTLAPVGEIIRNAFSGFTGEDMLGAGTIAGVIALVATFGAKIWGLFDGFGEISENFGEMLESVKDSVQGFAMGIKSANLVLIALALGMLAVSLKTLETINAEDLTKGLTALSVALGAMMVGLAVISKFNIVGGLSAATTLVAISVSVNILAGAIEDIAQLNVDELKRGLAGLAGIVTVLSVAIITISKLGGKMTTGSIQMIALAGAVVILADAVEQMAGIKSSSLAKSLGALTIIFAGIAGFLKVVDGSKFGLSSALGIVAVSGAIQIMVDAISDIALIDSNALIIGLTTIGLLLTEIAAFSKVAGGPQMLLAGAGIVLISGAIQLLIPAVTALSEMTWEELAKGLGGMAAAMLAVASAGVLATGAIGGAVAITLLAAGLNLLIQPIQAFSEMSWQELAMGLGGMAASMGIVAGAAMLLTPAVPGMIGFGAAVALLGVGALAAGGGLALLGTGLATLATLTAASVAAIVAALGTILDGINKLIPGLVTVIVNFGKALLDGIDQLATPLLDLIVKIVISLLEVITQHLPRFLELGIKLVVQLIEGIAEYTPILVNTALELVIDLINGMANAIQDYGPQLISAVWNLLGEIILLMVEAGSQAIVALFGWIPGVEKAAAEIGKTAEKYIRDNFGAEQAGIDKGGEFIKGVESKKPGSKTAGETLAKQAEAGLKTIDMTAIGQSMGTNVATGLDNSRYLVNAKAKLLASQAVQSMNTTLGVNSPAKETIKTGEWTGEGVAVGMENKKKRVATAAKSVADTAKASFDKAMSEADYKFKMGTIDSDGYVAEIEKIKKSYAKYPELVQKANLQIQKIQKQTFDDQLKYFENEYKLGQSTTEQYILNLKEMEKASAKRPEDLQKVQLKIQKAEEDASKERIDILKKEHDEFKSIIEDKKYYNKLSLAEELSMWETARVAYAENTEQRKEADREVYRLRNEINDKVIATNDEMIAKVDELEKKEIDSIKAVNDEYDKAYESRSNSLANFAGIFDEITEKTEVSGEKLLDNLRGQFSTLQDWTKNIAELAGRGIDTELLGVLREMGPKSASEIAALNSLTETQLQEYSEIWKQKNELAKTQTATELEELRKNTDLKVQAIKDETAVTLEEYRVEWLNKISEIRKGTNKQFIELQDDMVSSGTNVMNGLIRGMSSKRGELYALAQSIAAEISEVMNSTLGVASPSKVTTKTGVFVGEGLGVGMAKTIPDIIKTARTLATTASDTIDKFIQGTLLPTHEEMRLSMILDVDTSQLDFLNGQNRNIFPELTTSNRLVQETRRSQDDRVGISESKVVDQSKNYNPTINIESGYDGKAIARDTERSLRRVAFEMGVV